MEKILELILSKIELELNKITADTDHETDEAAIKTAISLINLYLNAKEEM